MLNRVLLTRLVHWRTHPRSGARCQALSSVRWPETSGGLRGAETHQAMPENLAEAKTGGLSLLFPDDLEGTEFRLTEPSLYSAEEVRDELDAETPEFGRWLPVETADEGEGFANAPGELIDELQRLEAQSGEAFEVTRCQKSGRDETSPFEVNVEKLSDDGQKRL